MASQTPKEKRSIPTQLISADPVYVNEAVAARTWQLPLPSKSEPQPFQRKKTMCGHAYRYEMPLQIESLDGKRTDFNIADRCFGMDIAERKRKQAAVAPAKRYSEVAVMRAQMEEQKAYNAAVLKKLGITPCEEADKDIDL